MQQLWQTLTDALATLDPTAYLALVVVVAVIAQWIAWAAKVPSILLLLVIGFLLGRFVQPDDILGRDVLFAGVNLAVGIILFEGALTLRFRDIRDLKRPILRLSTITVLVAWVLISTSAWLVGFQIEMSVLVGAILVVTGPTVIAPILRMIRPTRRVSSLLKWEGIIVDPIGAVLAVLVFQGMLQLRSGDPLPELIQALVMTLLLSLALGLGLGWIVGWLMYHHAIPDFLHGVFFVAVAVGALVASDAIQTESGLLTVTVMGIYLGNQKRLRLRLVEEFAEHLQVLFVGALFLVLAARIAPSDIVDVAPRALIFVALLVLVVRPVSIMLGLIGTRVSREERSLMLWMAPRGIVAAAITSVFGLQFTQAADDAAARAAEATGAEAEALLSEATQLSDLAEQASELVPLVFIVIVSTVAIYGLGIGRLAERLGLAARSPQGVLFVGGQQWIVDAATTLNAAGVKTRVVSNEFPKTAKARRVGLDTVTANILSEYAAKDMELTSFKSLIAATPADEVNATAAREFSKVLGQANVFQLPQREKPAGATRGRTNAADHLTVSTCFNPPRTNTQLKELIQRGFTVKHTRLTSAFTRDDFQEMWGDEPVYMFVLNEGEVDVVNGRTKVPRKGVSIISLVPPRPPARPDRHAPVDARGDRDVVHA